MKTFASVMLLLITFLTGAVTGVLTSIAVPDDTNQLTTPAQTQVQQDTLVQQAQTTQTRDKDSPSDWIKENQIRVYDNQVIIDIDNPIWAKFADTKSMDPVFDSTSHAIEVIPKHPNEISVGDIIVYEVEDFDTPIIHRVIEKGIDDQGVFFIAKGDNNLQPDPYKIRFPQITRVLVAIIY